MDKECCCIIVSYNIGRKLEKCVFSIINQVEQVVIVDNGSDNETIEYIQELEKKYRIEAIYNQENLGIAKALNQGIEYAKTNKYKWILTMDNDSEATEKMVESMFYLYNQIDDQTIYSIFPTYIEKGIVKNKSEIKSKLSNEYEVISNDITSGNLVKTEVFEEIGMFEEKLFIDCVDHEICFRMLEQGKKMIKAKDAILLHSLGNSKVKKIIFKDVVYTNHSPLRKYYMTRNRMFLWQKYKKLEKEIKIEKKNFWKENLKIILLEKEKIEKFKMIFKGYLDFKNNKFGKFN